MVKLTLNHGKTIHYFRKGVPVNSWENLPKFGTFRDVASVNVSLHSHYFTWQSYPEYMSQN